MVEKYEMNALRKRIKVLENRIEEVYSFYQNHLDRLHPKEKDKYVVEREKVRIPDERGKLK